MNLRLSEPNKNYESSIETLNSDLTKLKTRLSKTVLSNLTENGQETNGSKRVSNGERKPSRESESSAGAVADDQDSNGLHPFQVEFIRNMIEDAIEDSR